MVGSPPLRIVFLGSPAFAVPTLATLLRSANPVVGVVTQPDRPRGRGQRLSAGPVKTVGVSAGIPVLQPLSLKDPQLLERVAALRADLGVVAAYGKLLPESLLAMPRLGMINVHASLLPKYRGAAPIQRAVAAGERETGVSIMRVVKALDAGPVLATASVPIGPNATSIEVERDLAALGASLLLQTVAKLAAGTAVETDQDDSRATYAPRLTKEDGRIDWTQTAQRIHDLVRALHPWPHAFSYIRGQRIIILETRLLEDPAAAQSSAPPGLVLAARGETLLVATGSGNLQVTRVQTEGARPMSMREFLSGHPLSADDRFTTARDATSEDASAADGVT